MVGHTKRNRNIIKMKIGFLGDLFVENLNGGGELNDAVLIDSLKKKHSVTKHWCSKANIQSLDKEDLLIISNFVTLPTPIHRHLSDKKYIIYEHDHKYTKMRDVSKYSNFDIPKDQLIHRDFYLNADKVVVLSAICKDILEKNNISDKVYNIGCSLWFDETLDRLGELSITKKKFKYAVVDNQNPIKGLDKSLKYCSAHGIKPHMIKSNDYYNFLKQLSECENLIFFPQVLETYSRLAAEAKMLNCNLITTPNMLGFASEPYSSLKGDQLIEKIRSQKNKALKMFENWCAGE